MTTNPIIIIGGGSIGRRHIRNLQALGYNNIYCLKRNYSIEFENEFNVIVITSYDDFSDIKPWAVFICNPTSMHIDSLQHCVDNNTHVFMEKPLIHNEIGLENAKSLLNNYHKVFFIGFMLRFHPLVVHIKSILDNNTLGNVYAARLEFGSYLPYWHPYEDYKTSYASQKELGGGVVNTITHELDLIQYFFGSPISVLSHKANFNKLNIEVEELFESILVYNDKLVTLHLDYLQKDYDRRISILCDNGSIKWDWHENMILIKKHKSETKKITLDDFDVNKLYIDELKEFFRLINANLVTHNLDGSHAIENTKINLAMHHSSNLKQQIKLT